MNNTTFIMIIFLPLLLTACGDQREYTAFARQEDIPDKVKYEADNTACRKYAYGGDSAFESALGGALLGAAIGGATAMALDANVGYVAASTATTGGIIGLTSSAGENDKKVALVNCMLSKGHPVQGVHPVYNMTSEDSGASTDKQSQGKE